MKKSRVVLIELEHVVLLAGWEKFLHGKLSVNMDSTRNSEMAKKNKAAAAASDTGVSSPQGSGEGGGQKEGSFLLGELTWEDAGGGRWQCAETGHELLEREEEAYARSRACRLALIDHAVAHRKPPLNAFKPHPEHKSKLICNITGGHTGDTINKSEEHIWKHVNEKRFLNKLENRRQDGIW